MGKATIASIRNFQRQREVAIHQASGRPIIKRMADTTTASSMVSRNACQLISISDEWFVVRDS